ncbi:OmpA family protein [Falsiroseomonas sp.]|uniref:OmpA family protein n=1 Tax=Falsiroseomonas sp. TaxID=2870721 RepID=UPI003F7127B4
MRLLLFLLALSLALAATDARAETPPPACLFPRGGIALDEACQELLAGLARDWQAQPAGAAPAIAVRGFAQDQQGPRLDGLLSRRRAEAVAEELQRLGVARDRIEVSTPPAEQRDLHSRIDPRSRRAEIQLLARP